MYVCMYVCMYVYMYLLYVCMYVCMYVCIYVCVSMYVVEIYQEYIITTTYINKLCREYISFSYDNTLLNKINVQRYKSAILLAGNVIYKMNTSIKALGLVYQQVGAKMGKSTQPVYWGRIMIRGCTVVGDML